MVIAILTQENMFTTEEIDALRTAAIAKQEKAVMAAKKEAEKKEKEEEAAREAEAKAKAEAKKAAREASEAEAKIKRKAEIIRMGYRNARKIFLNGKFTFPVCSCNCVCIGVNFHIPNRNAIGHIHYKTLFLSEGHHR